MINADKAREMVKAFNDSKNEQMNANADRFIEGTVAEKISLAATKGLTDEKIAYPANHEIRKLVETKLKETYGFTVTECNGFWSISW